MGDWTSYIDGRLSHIEKTLFGEAVATQISEQSPIYDATTEAATTAGPVPATGTLPPAGTAPAGPPVGPAVPVDAPAPPPDQSALIAKLQAELEAAYKLIDDRTAAEQAAAATTTAPPFPPPPGA